jgi:hypothetical protein
MSMPSLADPTKLKKLVNTFLWTPQIRLQDAMTIANIPTRRLRIKPFAASFSMPSLAVPSRHSRHKLPGSYHCHLIAPNGNRNGLLSVPPPLSTPHSRLIPLLITLQVRLKPAFCPLLQSLFNCFPMRRSIRVHPP